MQLQEDKANPGRKDFVTRLTEFGLSMRSTGSVTPTRLGNAAHAAPELLAKVTQLGSQSSKTALRPSRFMMAVLSIRYYASCGPLEQGG